MIRFSAHLLIFLLVSSCSNLENASPSNRRTFMRFYEAAHHLTASALEVIPDGYVILGNLNVTTGDTAFTQAALLNISPDGSLVGNMHFYPGGSGKSFKPLFHNGQVNGYIIVGDSLFINPSAEQAANVEIYSMRLLFVDRHFNALQNFYLSDEVSTGNQIRIDYTGESVGISHDGKVVVLGTRKVNLNAPAEPFLLGISSAMDSSWFAFYSLIPGRTGINGRSIHYLGNQIFWTRSLSEVQGNFTNSWISLPVAVEGQAFINDSALGEYAAGGQYFISADIAVASNPAFGFGLTGTFSKSLDGSRGNIFFVRAYANGTFVPGSMRFFDMSMLTKGILLTDSTLSESVDEGRAVTATRDGGFVIAGTFKTLPGVLGRGGKDIVLLKVSATGNLIWYRLLGGSGDDIPVAVRETPEGDLVVAGTHILGNYAAVFLLKTDPAGNMIN